MVATAPGALNNVMAASSSCATEQASIASPSPCTLTARRRAVDPSVVFCLGIAADCAMWLTVLQRTSYSPAIAGKAFDREDSPNGTVRGS
jgi:hypothetical protein